MSYDIATRATPIPFTVGHYGGGLEHIIYGVLAANSSKPYTPEIPLTPAYEDMLVSDAFKNKTLQEFFLVVRVTDMEDHGAVETENDPLWEIQILAVSPKSCAKTVMRARNAAIMEGDSENEGEFGMEDAYALATYGKAAVCWSAYGDDREVLLTEAKKRLSKVAGMIGLYLSQPQNAVGETGWDWIRDTP